jgi:hypothetical protein
MYMPERRSPYDHRDNQDVRPMDKYEFFHATCRQEQDRVVFTDPTTREMVNTETLPNFLLRDQNLRTGYNFLQEFGSLLRVDTIFARHKSNEPEGLGDKTFNFEGRVRNSDIVLLEGLGWNEELQRQLNNLSKGRQISQEVIQSYLYHDDRSSKFTNQDINQYRLREIQAIANSSAHILFHDIDDGEDLLFIRKQMIEASEFTTELDRIIETPSDLGSEERETIKSITLAKQIFSLEALREWFMVANAGYQIAKACKQDPKLMQKLSDGDLTVMMIVGDSHYDIIRKFRTAQVEVTALYPRKRSLQSEFMSNCLSQGYVTDRELRRFIEGTD